MMQAKDVEVASPPSDGISELAFSPQADFLAVSSWDNQVRVYEVEATGNTVPRALFAHDAPALCVAWSKDGTKLVSGGADKAVRMFDINTGQATQVAEHAEPVRCAKFLNQAQNILATGSWDKTLKYWDLRTPQPIGTVQLPERCYAMDTVGNLLVVGTAERHICLFDLSNPTVMFKQTLSSLKWQTRVVSCFVDGKGYAVGSIEGRVAVQYVEEKEQAKNFSFKCHRVNNKDVYSVNAISVHPTYGTFSTAGADGVINFWDKDAKQNLKIFPNMGGPIAASAFNRNGTLFAYAVSYDWNKGYKFAKPDAVNKICLHAVQDNDIKPRSRTR